MIKRELTPKEILFVEEYVKDLHAGKAALRAGYPEAQAIKAGIRNLRNPQILEAIQASRDLNAQSSTKRKEEILSNLANISKSAIQVTNYVDSSNSKPNAQLALKALELEGKMMGIFTPNPEPEKIGLKVHIDLGDTQPSET